MSLLFLRRSAWVIVLLVAIAFIGWTTTVRLKRIEYVNGIGREATEGPAQPGRRQLIVPEHITNSYGWISETQQMMETGSWRVRETAAENAPFGREVHSASPYRWWLGGLAALDHRFSGSPPAAAVERAALWVDPLFFVLVLAATAALVAFHFGAAAAAFVALASATFFPFAAGFLPGVPDDFACSLGLAPWSVLPLLIGLRSARSRLPPGRRRAVRPDSGHLSRWFFVGGVFSGLGLWIDVIVQVPILFGIAFGGVLAAVVARTSPDGPSPDDGWRWWGLGGASTLLVAYLIEYAPSHLGGWELRVFHPVYGLSWLGGAELLAWATRWIRIRQRPAGSLAWIRVLGGVAATAALPVAMVRTHSLGFLNVDLLAFRLTKQTEGALAPNTWEWLVRDGLTGPVAAVLMPLLLLAMVVRLLLRRDVDRLDRQTLALALGPVVIALALAQFHLRWWQMFDALLIIAGVAATVSLVTQGGRRTERWTAAAVLVLIVVVGVAQIVPLKDLGGRNVLSLPEVEGLVERDLAHALAKRVGRAEDAIVHAPPSVTTALAYYGGLRGLSSLSWENKAGLSVALRVVISTSREEAHALLLSRGVTHLVIPTWDPFFDPYTTSASVQASELFYNSLRRWVVPLWLRPIPYRLPTIGGFENQSVTVFEVVDEQEAPTAMSRMTEYFIEMDQLEAARAAGEALRRYPADFSALIAQAQLEAAMNDASAFAATFQTLLQRLNARADRLLPLDRRLSLAVTLARGQRPDLARPQVERCLQQLDERRLRFLTTHAQFHLLYLAKALDLDFPDPALRELALELIPFESRSRL